MVGTVLTALAVIAAVLGLLYLAYLILARLAVSRRRSKKTGVHAGAVSQMTPAKTANKRDWSKWVGTARSILVVVLIALGVIWLISLAVHSFSGGQSTSRYSPYAQRTASTGRSQAELELQAVRDRDAIESKSYDVTVKFGERPAWIRNPGGSYKVQYEVEGDKVLGMQCSPTAEAPSIDAVGPDTFVCSDSVTTNWFRFFAMTTDDQVKVHYCFRKVELQPSGDTKKCS